MRKTLSNILIAVLVVVTVATASFPALVQAQQTTTTTNSGSFTDCIIGNAKDISNSNGQNCVKKALDISWQGILLAAPAYLASYIVLPLVGWITTLSGLLLNFAVDQTVIQMADNFSKIPAIDVVWGAVRDLVNMFFIFILLYSALMTMFGKDGYQRTIANMVIAAILINFSLFFTKIVIDAGNLLALTFYHAIVSPAASGDRIFDTGISNALMDQLHLSTIWKISGLVDNRTLLTIGVMGSAVALVAAFVFFAVAIMFIIRYVVLIMVLVLSPIYFAGMILPNMKGYAKDWLDTLIGQTFFAPAYFFLTWIAIKLSRSIYITYSASLTTTTETATAGGAVPADPTNIGQALAGTFDSTGNFHGSGASFAILMNYGLTIAFLIISLMVAKKVASKSGKMVNGLTGKALSFAGSSTYGVAGRFGRGTLGRAGSAIADNEYLKDKAPTSRLARLALSAGNKTATASFDARNTGLGKTLGAGQGQGKGKGGGFAADLKAKIKTQTDYAKSLGPSDLAVASAEAKLKTAKDADTSTAEYQKVWKSEVRRLETEAEAARNRVDNARKSGASREEISHLQDTLTTAEVARDEVSSDVNKFKDSEVKRAERKVDELKGVDENEAKKRVGKLVNKSGKALNAYIKEGAGKDSLERMQQKSAANVRKERYAQGIEEQKTLGMGNKYAGFDVTGRVGVIGPVKKENLASALAIRKSMKEKKPAEKIAEEIEKQAKEAKNDEGGEEGETPTTPDAGGAAPAADAGSTPPAAPTT